MATLGKMFPVDTKKSQGDISNLKYNFLGFIYM